MGLVHVMLTPGENGFTRWREFVMAMEDIGCVVKSNGGSETQFQILSHEGSINSKKSINFHKTHWSDPKIYFK